MTVEIHPTALVDPKSKLDDGVLVEPYAIVEEGTTIGKGSKVEAHAIIKRGSRIGESCTIGHFSVVGGLPQHLSFNPNTVSFVDIGDSVRMGEGVTIHRSMHEEQNTIVGDHCFLMGNSHVAHDCKMGKSVLVANGALLGGHVELGHDVFVGGGAALHQFVRVGDGAMLGGLAEISADVPPQITVAGRNLASGLNLIGLKRRGAKREEIAELKNLYRHFLSKPGNLKGRAEELLESSSVPKTELGLNFTKFFLSGDRNFARSRNLSKNKVTKEDF